MGSSLCSLFRQKPVTVMYFGLDAAGKTTLLYNLKLGEVVTTIPTIGFNIETLDMNGVRMTTWDIGLRDKIRPLMLHYLEIADAVVFVVDSSDTERLEEAVDGFFRYVAVVVQEKQLPVLVLANKQDMEKVMSLERIQEAIFARGGPEFRANTALEIFPTNALTLEGVDAAMTWLTSQLVKRIARDSYRPYLSLSHVTSYPASFVKSAYRTLSSLVYSSEDKTKISDEQQTTVEKDKNTSSSSFSFKTNISEKQQMIAEKDSIPASA